MRQHSALILKWTAEACSVLPLMNVLLYHIWNIITGYPSIMEIESPGTSSHPYLQSINIWYPSDQNAINFLVKFLPNFQRKHVEISIIYECNLKIVKICQKCANLESGSLSEKLLDARRFSSKAIQLLSPKNVNLLISLPDFLLLRNEIGRILCWGMLE